MMSQLPLNIAKVKPEDVNKEIARVGIIAELDAVSLYEQLAAMASNTDLRNVFLAIAKEEKTHLGEFAAMLARFDTDQVAENAKAKEEIKKLTGK